METTKTKVCPLPTPVPIKTEHPFLISSIRKGEEKRQIACGTDLICLEDIFVSNEQLMFKVLGILLIVVLFSTIMFAVLMIH